MKLPPFVEDRVGRPIETDGREVAWVGAAVGASSLVYLVYLWTHPFPGFGAGLYSQMATEIVASGYRLPDRIPGYTVDGVPFAYPPLTLYLTAAILDVGGADPVELSRVFPGLVVAVAVIPYYGLARELLESATEAGLAAILLAVTPAVLRWHLSAGGIVRAPAFLFTAVGLYAGIKLCNGQRAWFLPSLVAFALTVLSHPTYAVFFGVSYLLMVSFFDRTARGLATGIVVAFGGLVLTAPWWLQVVSNHGVGVFAGAAGTHSGLGGGVDRFVAAFASPLYPDAETPFYLAAYAGGIYCIANRKYFLPTWLVAAGYLLGESRFMFVPGAMLTAILTVRWVCQRPWSVSSGWGRQGKLRAVLLVLVVAGGLGILYAAGGLSVWHGSASQPAYIDSYDREAMNWVRTNTEPDSAFVVIGDAAEWFPALAGRPILVGHWGVEWVSPEAYHHQLAMYERLSSCETDRCVGESIAAAGVEPEHLYVPRGHYTIRGKAHRAPPRLVQSLSDADGYRLAYVNEGVAVFRVVSNPSTERRSSQGRHIEAFDVQ